MYALYSGFSDGIYIIRNIEIKFTKIPKIGFISAILFAIPVKINNANITIGASFC